MLLIKSIKFDWLYEIIIRPKHLLSSLMFLFYGGEITEEIKRRIKVDGKEILSFNFMSKAEIREKTPEILYRRIEKAQLAIDNET